FELIDLSLHHSLSFTGTMVLSILFEIPLGAGGRNARLDLRHLNLLQLVEFCLDLVVAGTGHGDTFAHLNTISYKTGVHWGTAPGLLPGNSIPPSRSDRDKN